MLALLLKTRLKYYRNYIRYHFDRTTKIEIALIFLVLLLLTLRSPSDIGYNFRWMNDENFPQNWANFFAIYLLFFYLISQAFAYHTFRFSTEWQLLGILPFHKNSITSYYLFRHLSKLLIFFMFGCLPFLFASTDGIGLRILRFFTAVGALVLLQLTSFNQLNKLRNLQKCPDRRIIGWLLVQLILIGTIILIAGWLRSVLSKSINIGLFSQALLWGVLPFYWRFIQRNFILCYDDSKPIQKRQTTSKKFYSLVTGFSRGFYRSCIFHDILFLWRHRKSSLIIPVLCSVIAITICIVEENIDAIYVSLIFVQAFFSLLFINTLLSLFMRDVTAFEFIRSLPVTARSLWLGRWLFIVIIIAMPLLIPIVIMLIKSGITLEFFLFIIVVTVIIPSVFATIVCNSCFGMFPHINLSGYIIIISIILMVLFWFFMPFGTLILLTVIIFWIRKSQRNFQYLEI